MSNGANNTMSTHRYDTDRRYAATASLKQRIKINQGLTDSLRKKLKTREIYTRGSDMPSTHRKIRVLNSSYDFSSPPTSGPLSFTIEPNYLKLQNQSHQMQYQAHMYKKYPDRRGKSSTIEHINIPVKSPTKVYNLNKTKDSILPE